MRIPVRVIDRMAPERRSAWDDGRARPYDRFADDGERDDPGPGLDPSGPRPEEREAEVYRDETDAEARYGDEGRAAASEVEERSEGNGEKGRRPVARDDLGADDAKDDWESRYVRLLADFENHKRHCAKERAELAGIGKEAVLGDLFPLVEHMERALKAAADGGDNSAILEGVKMVHRELLAVLAKNGVERIPAVGQPFDPALHEALAAIPSAAAEGAVIEEIRPGFTRNGKLLRPAGVVVARGEGV